MKKVVLYTTPICPYCVRAKRLLSSKGVSWEEVDVSGDESLREMMMEKAGGRFTVPQIFVGETHVGGCDELYALDRAGQLDPLLNAS